MMRLVFSSRLVFITLAQICGLTILLSFILLADLHQVSKTIHEIDTVTQSNAAAFEELNAQSANGGGEGKRMDTTAGGRKIEASFLRPGLGGKEASSCPEHIIRSYPETSGIFGMGLKKNGDSG